MEKKSFEIKIYNNNTRKERTFSWNNTEVYYFNSHQLMS